LGDLNVTQKQRKLPSLIDREIDTCLGGRNCGNYVSQ
jgi:hypothetical protein